MDGVNTNYKFLQPNMKNTERKTILGAINLAGISETRKAKNKKIFSSSKIFFIYRIID